MAPAPRSPTICLTTPSARTRDGDRISRIAHDAGEALEAIAVASDDRLDDATLERIDLAYFPGGDAGEAATRRFFGAALRAPKLRWMHLGFVGLDHPVFARIAERGVILTNSPGVNAEAIALNALTGLLSLARGFPRWAEAQRRHAWSPTPAEQIPDDLRGQTLLVLGLGAIGSQLARFARAVGLHVIGVRRSGRRADDAIDELHPPRALPSLLPRAQWLAITCPLTPETRGWIDEAALRALPRGARVLNVARGAILDESALVGALEDGHLGGAYLDVFETEPLPADSPFWELANVILTPHDSHTSRGNAARSTELFLDNLARWLRGESLRNVVGGHA